MFLEKVSDNFILEEIIPVIGKLLFLKKQDWKVRAKCSEILKVLRGSENNEIKDKSRELNNKAKEKENHQAVLYRLQLS